MRWQFVIVVFFAITTEAKRRKNFKTHSSSITRNGREPNYSASSYSAPKLANEIPEQAFPSSEELSKSEFQSMQELNHRSNSELKSFEEPPNYGFDEKTAPAVDNGKHELQRIIKRLIKNNQQLLEGNQQMSQKIFVLIKADYDNHTKAILTTTTKPVCVGLHEDCENGSCCYQMQCVAFLSGSKRCLYVDQLFGK